MNKSEGWYFISDSMGAHYGQIYIGLELEGQLQSNNSQDQKNDKFNHLELDLESSLSGEGL